ncbi:MAG: hypothetical protein AAF657_06015 [Acidobacteriota bacterium]
MNRPVLLAFACLASFLVLVPLTLKKPGLPMQLYGNEATQYLTASSLIHDGDLRCDAADLDRLFAEFPFAQGVAVELLSDDGWQTARFAGPVIYPLLAAPFGALAGGGGVIALNALLFLTVIGAACWRLRRFATEGMALLYGTGFFVFSTAFVYLFRMQAEIFVMAAVMLSFCLGWVDRDDPKRGGSRRTLVLSGLALALAVAHEPALALLGLPLLAGHLGRNQRAAGAWLLGFAGTLVLTLLLTLTITGYAWPPTSSPANGEEPGIEVTTFRLSSPHDTPWKDDTSTAEGGRGETLASATSATNSTSAPLGRRSITNVVEDAAFLFWGRRTGLLPYFPLILPILFLFATAVQRTRPQWVLLASGSALAVLQLIFEPTAAALYDAQIGNPNAVAIYPTFLFLLSRLPARMVTLSYGLGALVLSTLLLTLFGAGVPNALNHAHTRNFPFAWLPFEYPTLGRAADFSQLEIRGIASPDTTAKLFASSDQAEEIGGELWMLGGEAAELWLVSRQEVPSMVFNLRNTAPTNHIELALGKEKHERAFEDTDPQGIAFQLAFRPRRPHRVRYDSEGRLNVYRLRLDTRYGEKPRWAKKSQNPSYVGTALSFLGTQEFLQRDIYPTEWLSCDAPPTVAPEEAFLAVVRLRNASPHPWPALGTARVQLSYHWLSPAGENIAYNGLRTELAETVEPGAELTSWLTIEAPQAPGRYLLEVDPVLENVAWFSTRNGGSTCRAEIDVTAPDER